MNAAVPALSCENLRPQTDYALAAPLTLTLPRQSITCIVGPCNTGKTALLRLLGGVDSPSDGILKILGHDIWDLSAEQWRQLRQRAGYVLPSSALLSSLSVLNNVMLPAHYHQLGSRTAIREQAQKTLAWLGFIGDDQQLPAYFPEYQRRLIAIARCLILAPEMLFIDEAFAFLDALSCQPIAQRYLDMRHKLNITLVLATHNLNFARQCADILIFTHPDGPLRYDNWDEIEHNQDPYIQAYIQASDNNINLNAH